jgi:TolB-like protein
VREFHSAGSGAALSLALFLLAGGATPLEARQANEDVPTVAILDFAGFMMSDAGNSPHIGKAVSSMLVTEFSGRDGLRPIERDQLQSLLTEQGLALSGRVDESTSTSIGQMVGAQYMIGGQATSVSNELRLDIRIIDVETSEVLQTLRLSDSPEELLSLVVRIADAFYEQLNLPAPSERPEVEEIPVAATIEFSRGVDYEDRGDLESALEHYQRALEIHPGHRDAQRALERLGGNGGSDR